MNVRIGKMSLTLHGMSSVEPRVLHEAIARALTEKGVPANNVPALSKQVSEQVQRTTERKK